MFKPALPGQRKDSDMRAHNTYSSFDMARCCMFWTDADCICCFCDAHNLNAAHAPYHKKGSFR